MGRDRNLPSFFARIHEHTHTPYLALAASGALIIFMAVAIPIADVAAAADVMFLLLFLQVNVAILVIRKRYGDKLDYGFVMPFHPVLPVLNMALILFLALFLIGCGDDGPLPKKEEPVPESKPPVTEEKNPVLVGFGQCD